MNFMKKLPPKVSTLSAVAVGYILLDDSTYVEQNAIGNWLMLIAQVLCTMHILNNYKRRMFLIVIMIQIVMKIQLKCLKN